MEVGDHAPAVALGAETDRRVEAHKGLVIPVSVQDLLEKIRGPVLAYADENRLVDRLHQRD